MKNRTRIIVWILAIILIIPVGFVSHKYFIRYNDKEIIYYNNRSYAKSQTGIVDLNDARFKECSDTGKTSKGLKIFDLTDRENVSTVVFVKDKNGDVYTYSLMGGP